MFEKIKNNNKRQRAEDLAGKKEVSFLHETCINKVDKKVKSLCD